MKAPLHRRRLLLAEYLRITRSPVDVFVPGLRGEGRIAIGESLRRYHFSIILENNISPGYFTEKLLNCFALGTVPVYVGAPDIGSYFNLAGIVPARGLRDIVQEIIPNLSIQDYQDRTNAIHENFSRGQRYMAIEDFIVSNHADLFGEFRSHT